MPPGSSYSLKYDAWNRLVEVKHGATVKQANEYDGLNRRIIRDETGGSGDKIHFYYSQQWQVLEERKEVSGTEDTDPLNQYIYHPYYVDAIALRDYDEDVNGSTVRHYYLQDANFNVTAVANDTGTVLERYAYTPYGEVTVLDADFSADADGKSDISNEHLYTGRRLDPETGLQLNRNRFYHSGLGRWVNRDPIGYDGGINLYGYVNGMPLDGLDPEGKFVCSGACIAAIFAGAAGAACLFAFTFLGCPSLQECTTACAPKGIKTYKSQFTLPETIKVSDNKGVKYRFGCLGQADCDKRYLTPFLS